MLPHHQIIIRKSSSEFFNNVILARNRQLPDDDRMIETCRSIFKSFNVNNLSVCIGCCADQVIKAVVSSERVTGKIILNVDCLLILYTTNIKRNDVH